MKRLLLALLLTATALPASAKDTSFAFKGEYRGTAFAVEDLSVDERAKLDKSPNCKPPGVGGGDMELGRE